MKKSLLAGVALAILSAAAASAADLPRAAAPYAKAPIATPYPAPIFTWTGGYIGVNGGWATANSFDVVSDGAGLIGPAAGNVATGLKPQGGFFGGTVGYNWQVPNSMFVLGVEGNADLADISDSRTLTTFGPASLGATSKLDKFGTVVGRAGIAVDRSLFFVTGGLAVGYNEGTLDLAVPPVVGARLFDSQTHVGWTAGAGYEYAFANNWSVKAEYSYMDLGAKNYQFISGAIPGPGGGPVMSGLSVDPTFHVIKVGINHKLDF